MREVRLKHYFVHSDEIKLRLRTVFLKPERRPEVIAEILPWAPAELAHMSGQHLVELVLVHFQHERHPADPRFDQTNLQLRIAIQETGHDPVTDRGGAAERGHYRIDGQLLLEWETFPDHHVGVDRHIDVEIDRR